MNEEINFQENLKLYLFLPLGQFTTRGQTINHMCCILKETSAGRRGLTSRPSHFSFKFNFPFIFKVIFHMLTECTEPDLSPETYANASFGIFLTGFDVEREQLCKNS